MIEGRISGEKLRKLTEQHKLTGDAGASKVADLIGVKRCTVQQWYSRGVPRIAFECLVYKLSPNKETAETTLKQFTEDNSNE